jgi:hypothetical protein
MKLTGGFFGGYEKIDNQVVLGDEIKNINLTNLENEFFVISDNEDKWFYIIDGDIAIFFLFEPSI